MLNNIDSSEPIMDGCSQNKPISEVRILYFFFFKDSFLAEFYVSINKFLRNKILNMLKFSVLSCMILLVYEIQLIHDW